MHGSFRVAHCVSAEVRGIVKSSLDITHNIVGGDNHVIISEPMRGEKALAQPDPDIPL